jgi:hypothetical protein
MRIKIAALLFCICASEYTLGQALGIVNLPNIQTDRPDKTECAFLVPAKHIQFESGIAREWNNGIGTTILPTLLTRYALNQFIELRCETFHRVSKNATVSLPTAIGFKAMIAKEKGPWPAATFIGHMNIPTVESTKRFIMPSVKFCLQHNLSNIFSLNYNLGMEYDGFIPSPIYLYTVSTGITFTDKVGGFVEAYGNKGYQIKWDHKFDAGLTYLLKKNVQLDCSAGIGLYNNSFISAGYSVRLPR